MAETKFWSDDQIVRDFGICVVRTPDGKVKVLGSDVGMTKGVRVCSSEGNGEKPTKSSKGFCKKNSTLLMRSKVQDVLRDCEVVGVPGSIATEDVCPSVDKRDYVWLCQMWGVLATLVGSFSTFSSYICVFGLPLRSVSFCSSSPFLPCVPLENSLFLRSFCDTRQRLLHAFYENHFLIS
jgi:hypothetical protein